MKGKLFVGVLALGLWGGAALAADQPPKMRDIMVTAGAGFEGYTGELRNAIAPGVAWGIQGAFKPTTVLGLELGYSGAVNELRNHAAFDVTGADIVRNGGHVLATLGLATTRVQPYLLGGVGLNWYDVRAMGTRETSGNVPVGAGIRAKMGQFTADARLHYNFLLDNDLMSVVGPAAIAGYGSGTSGKYVGSLSIGGAF